MAIVKTTAVWEEEFSYRLAGDPYTIYTRVYLRDVETGEYLSDGVTFTTRRQVGRHGTGALENEFNNRIRAVAEVWHNILNDDERAAWKAADAAKDGARPNMSGTDANGWNLFAMVALAPVALNITAFLEQYADATTEPDAVTFDKAEASTQELTFTLGFSNPPWSDAHIFAIVHQVDPLHIDRRSATRRTFCVGYYQCEEAPVGDQTFTTPIAFPFNVGDKVQVLLRLHRSLDGVDNHVLSCTAT
jgi:hypothetical protein